MARTSDHPFLSGNYAPVPDETTITGLRVEGSLPSALSGRYLRIGPNPIGNAPRPYCWTTGDGMVHAVTLHAGRAVSYRNRWVKTDAASARLGTEPVHGPRTPHDVANAGILELGGRTFAFGRDAIAYELGADLETVGRADLAGRGRGLPVLPRIDPVTGHHHLISSSPATAHRHHELGPTATPVGPVRSLSGPALPVADLALTGTRLVLTSPGAIGVAGRTGEARIDWLPASLDDSLQIVDAYDDGAAIVLGVITPSIERWVIDPPNERLHRQIVDPARRAFGRVDQRRLGSPHRYLYAISAGPLLPFDGTGIHKHELTDGTRESHDFGPGRHPGDPVFVADPDRTGVEDGGWLLSLVHDDTTGHTSLVVLDAADLAGPELAAVHLPRRIPYGLHGTWIPSTH